MEFYVIVQPQDGTRFISDLSVIAKRHGLTANPGQATDDRGNTMRVLEAKGRWLRVWSQNLPLSGEEDLAICGPHQYPHPDPSQFIVSLRPVLPFFGQKRADQLLSDLIAELKSTHYDVRMKPAKCGAAALSQEQ